LFFFLSETDGNIYSWQATCELATRCYCSVFSVCLVFSLCSGVHLWRADMR